jgi:plasmid stabilization system protein ParE
MTVHFESAALMEYRDAVLYSERRFGLGEGFIQAVESAIETILRDPERFQSVGPGVRIYRMRRFLYYIFYHYASASEVITIYAVAHHHRQPDYWRERLPD